MSLLDTIKSNISDTFSSIVKTANPTSTDPWTIDGQDWYRVHPYQFVIMAAKDKDHPDVFTDHIFYTLPIPPQSLNIQEIPAAQATPTFGGVVEEVSRNVFWNISLAGTTGIATTRDPQGNTAAAGFPSFDKQAIEFRDKISTTGLLSGIAAQLNQAINQVGGAVDGALAAAQAAANGNPADALGAGVGAFTNAKLPPLPFSASAVSGTNNGFTETHWLMYFFYKYSDLKSTNPDGYKLEFRYHKMQKKFQTTTPLLSITQSVQNPMLYRYQINFKGWSIENVDKKLNNTTEFDRFGPSGDLSSVNTIGAKDKLNVLNKVLAI